MKEEQPITEVRPFGNESIIPGGKYALLAMRKNGNQHVFVFFDEDDLHLTFSPLIARAAGTRLDEVTGILVSDIPEILGPLTGETVIVLPESTSGFTVQPNVDEDPDMYTALHTKRPLTVICAFVKDGQSLLILKSKSGRYLLKKFTLNSLNQAGWDSAVSNDGTNNYVYEIARNGEIECIHQPE